MFNFKLKKKQKPEGDGLKPRGIILTVIPKDYLNKFPKNDLSLFKNKKEVI